METIMTSTVSSDENFDTAISSTGMIMSDWTAEARELPDFDNHERVIRVSDTDSGLKAFIGLHDLTLGPALGGCRMWPYETETEAVTDVLRLSRGMTLTSAMAGVAAGGGKSVIIGDPRTDKTEALFRAFGRAVDQLDGRYISGEDVGVSVQDMDWAASETPYMLGTGERGGDPSPTTAYGVFVGLKAAVRHRLRRDSLDGVVVAVQGLGHVGFSLCELLRREGAALVVTDIDESALERAKTEFDAEAVATEDIYDVDAEVFAPCALGAILNDDTVPRLRVAVVAGAANNQLHADRNGEMLKQHRILYAPDYVINAGGLIALSLARTPDGYTAERALSLTARIGDTLAEIFSRADDEDRPTNAVADNIALERVRNAASD